MPFSPVKDVPIVSASGNLTASDTVVIDSSSRGRYLAINCTVAGNVKVGFPDATTYTFPVATGLTIMPFTIAQLFSTGTTATATYNNLH